MLIVAIVVKPVGCDYDTYILILGQTKKNIGGVEWGRGETHTKQANKVKEFSIFQKKKFVNLYIHIYSSLKPIFLRVGRGESCEEG